MPQTQQQQWPASAAAATTAWSDFSAPSGSIFMLSMHPAASGPMHHNSSVEHDVAQCHNIHWLCNSNKPTELCGLGLATQGVLLLLMTG